MRLGAGGMRLTRLVRRRGGDDGILPLINIVFLLLIFFMVAGRWTASDPFEVVPPRSQSEAAAGAPGLTVLAGPRDRLALDGRVLSEAALMAAVAEHMAAMPAAPVQLRADAGADARWIVEIMEGLRRVGVPELRLLTLEGAQR